MDEKDKNFVVNVALAFYQGNAACTAAVFNAYFERRRLAKLPERLNAEDVVKLGLLLHHSTPPAPINGFADLVAQPDPQNAQRQPELPQGDEDPLVRQVREHPATRVDGSDDGDDIPGFLKGPVPYTLPARKEA
jgi:hypothetical protein